MHCMAKYIDLEGNEKYFYWVSYHFGSRKDCEKAMKEDGVKYKEILEINCSD